MGWLIGIACFIGGFAVASGLCLWFVHAVTKDFGKAFMEGWK